MGRELCLCWIISWGADLGNRLAEVVVIISHHHVFLPLVLSFVFMCIKTLVSETLVVRLFVKMHLALAHSKRLLLGSENFELARSLLRWLNRLSNILCLYRVELLDSLTLR